jgi:hypothetical protein
MSLIGFLSGEFVLELTHWTPLMALVLLSLGLIALNWMSGPWAKRLAAPPFYFVSLPVATLIVGAEMFAWMVAYVCELKELYSINRSLDIILLIWRGFGSFLQVYPVAMSVFIISSIVFCVLPFVSGRMLWRTLRQEDKGKYPSTVPGILQYCFSCSCSPGLSWACVRPSSSLRKSSSSISDENRRATSCEVTADADRQSGGKVAVERLLLIDPLLGD